MNSKHYEELCRYFVAEQLGLPLSAIQSLRVPSPERQPESWHTNLGRYAHQIDLYWETSNGTVKYVNIANAKWHGSGKVNLEDVLLLQQVRRKIGAHKAMLITNTDFGSGARRAAADEGIALLVLRPVFDPALLDADPRVHVQDRFQELAAAGATIYGWHVVQKGLGGAGSVAEVLGLASPLAQGGAGCQAYPTRSMTGPVRAPPASGSAGGNCGGYATRHGPGPGFRMK